jgi:hypothetical protein
MRKVGVGGSMAPALVPLQAHVILHFMLDSLVYLLEQV